MLGIHPWVYVPVYTPGYMSRYTTLGTPCIIPGWLTALVNGAPLRVEERRGPGLNIEINKRE